MTTTTRAKATNPKRTAKAAAPAHVPEGMYCALPASTMPTPAAPVVAPAAAAAAAPAAPTVNLRGLPVALRVNPAKVYRTGAAHNAHWWANVVAACANGPASTAALLQGATGAAAMHGPTATTATGAPGHFLGYAVRRGYLLAV